MTALEKEIQNLSKLQKVSLMEQIWTDLLKDQDSVDIPDWHLSELKETEMRVEEGKEEFIDLETAKLIIRDA